MKNTIKILGIIALIAIIGVTMVACGGGLSGTYADATGSMTFTFKGKNFTTEAWGQKNEGTFTTKDGKITFANVTSGREDTYSYTLEGDTLTLDMHGMILVLNKR